MGLHPASDHTAMSEINVTPLVDVMLVLLIVFMVTAPLLMQAVPVELPKTVPAPALIAARTLTLSINRRGEIFLDQVPVPLETLEARFAQARIPAAEIDLLVQADATVAFGRVAQVMAVAQRAGISKLSVVTQAQ
jgi:biopolymer transport protein ExbD